MLRLAHIPTHASGFASLSAVALILSLAACNGATDSSPPGTAPPDPPAGALPDDDDDGPSDLATLDIAADNGQLLASWEFAASLATRAGDGAHVRLHLDGEQGASDPSARLLEPAGSGIPVGAARFDVAAHRLGWRDTTLAAELLDAGGHVVAASTPMRIADALAETTVVVAPAVSLAGERFAQAIAFSADGGMLAIAQPAAGSVRLLPADTDSRTDIASTDGFDVEGFAGADQVRISAADFGATIGVWWQAAQSDASTLAIIEPFGEGWYESARFALSSLQPAVLEVAADGSAVSIAANDGSVERFIEIDDLWTHASAIPATSALGARAIVPEGSLALVREKDTSLALHGSDDDGEPLARSVLPMLEHDVARWVDGSSRLALDRSTRHLAVTALRRPDAYIDQVVATLWLFERQATADPWRLEDRIEREASSDDVALSVSFAGRADTDALLWHWSGAPDTGAQQDSAGDEPPFNALLMLVRRPAAAAFGTAARTSLPDSSWHAAFELPRDAGSLAADSRHAAAALSPAADRLAISWPPTHDSPDTVQPSAGENADWRPHYPAGYLRLID